LFFLFLFFFSFVLFRFHNQPKSKKNLPIDNTQPSLSFFEDSAADNIEIHDTQKKKPYGRESSSSLARCDFLIDIKPSIIFFFLQGDPSRKPTRAQESTPKPS